MNAPDTPANRGAAQFDAGQCCEPPEGLTPAEVAQWIAGYDSAQTAAAHEAECVRSYTAKPSHP